MAIKAVIFDMDGLLIDSEVIWDIARQEFAQTHGKVWTPDDHRQVMGRKTHDWAQIMQTRLGVPLSVDEIIADMKARMLAHYDVRLPLLPGTMEAVKLAATRYKTALASGSPTPLIDRVIKLTGLDQIFNAVVYGDDIANGKPAPDIYLETARRLGLPPAECVGVEDSASGVRAIKAAGMFAIAVPNPEYPLPQEVMQLADRVLPSLEAFSVELVEDLVR